MAGWGDPATDSACLIDVYGETFLRRLATHCPAIEEHIERARFWAGTLELQWFLTGLRSKGVSWFTVHMDDRAGRSAVRQCRTTAWARE